MNIQFFGAVRSVTGAQFLLRANDTNILLDCGLYQGPRAESYERNKNLPFSAAEVDVCVLSHAHIDHSGNIPNLVKSGFRGDIICTSATQDLATIMLRDSASIQVSDIEYVNKERARENLPAVEPIYDVADAIESLTYFLGIAYDRPRKIGPGITVTLHDAGHILGSAITVLDIEDKDSGKPLRVVFSGDLGRGNRPILCDPHVIDRADVLLIESTYGDREHEDPEKAVSMLKEIICDAYERGGRVIIPSFAVGRTQELVYRIHQLAKKDEIPNDIPVFVDSPLAIDATGIYRLHPEAYDEEAYNELLTSERGDAFGFDMLKYTRSVSESKAINDMDGPMVIISASGMAESGRILHHLKNGIGNPKTTVLIVGFQAPNTLGRRLVEKQKFVKIFGKEYECKARVEQISGFSAHADRTELFAWLDNFSEKPSKTFIVHGEEESSIAFGKELSSKGFKGVTVPRFNETHEL